MIDLKKVLGIARYDFKERIRSPKIILVSILVAYLVKIVTVDSTLTLGEYTGVLNSAWYGGMTAVAGTTFLLFFGFNIVKGSINREKEYDTEKLIESSPISKTSYVTGKWLSNFLFLSIAIVILMLATIVTVLLNGNGTLSLLAILKPFLIITVPTIGFISALTLFIENTDFLNGARGTAVYFLFVLFTITLNVNPDSVFDFAGLNLVRESMSNSITAQYPDFDGVIKSFAYTDSAEGLKKFTWQGLELTINSLKSRIPIFSATFITLIASIISFDRFKNKKSIIDLLKPGFFRKRKNISGRLYNLVSSKLSELLGYLVPRFFSKIRLFLMIKAEIKFLYRDRPKWWYLASIIGFSACLIAPISALKDLVLPLVLLLPTSIWSSLGVKEKKHKTEKLVLQNKNELKLLIASYTVGVLTGTILAIPALTRFIFAGSISSLIGLSAALLLLPALSLFMGIWSGREGLFQIIYFTAWYLGPMNGLTLLNYLNLSQKSLYNGTTAIIFLITLISLVMAAVGRKKQTGTDIIR